MTKANEELILKGGIMISTGKKVLCLLVLLCFVVSCSDDNQSSRRAEERADPLIVPDCSPTIPCSDGRSCVDGICVDPPSECDEARPCVDGKVCQEGQCVDQEPPPPVACENDAACAEGQYCHDGFCAAYCTDNADCEEGEACIGGRCGGIPSPACSEDKVMNQQGECVLKCKPFTQWDGYGCRAMDHRACSKRETFNGQECISCKWPNVVHDNICHFPCTSNEQWNGTECQAMNSSACAANETFDGQECIKCRWPRVVTDGACHMPCTGGKVWREGACVEPCPDNTQWNGEECVEEQASRAITMVNYEIVTDKIESAAAPGYAEIKFCPRLPHQNYHDGMYNEIFNQASCFSITTPHNGGFAKGRLLKSPINIPVRDNLGLDDFYYIKVTKIGGGNDKWYLSGLKITLGFDDESSKVVYSNPCISRWLSNGQFVALSRNDTAVCARIQTDGRNDNSWTDDTIVMQMRRSVSSNADLHIYPQDIRASYANGYATPYLSGRGANLLVSPLELDDNRREFRWDDDKSYSFTLFDSDSVERAFKILKDNPASRDSWGAHGIAVYVIRPGSIVGARSGQMNCSYFSQINGTLSGAVRDEEGWSPIYWINGEDNNARTNDAFPASEYQALNPFRTCNDWFVDDISTDYRGQPYGLRETL